MREALQADIDTWRWTAQAEHLESAEGRAQAVLSAELIERFLATAPKQPATLMVPPVLIGCITEGAEDMTHTIAQAIDNGEDLHECAAQLTAAASLLDALTEDTHAMVELDIAEHRALILRYSCSPAPQSIAQARLSARAHAVSRRRGHGPNA